MTALLDGHGPGVLRCSAVAGIAARSLTGCDPAAVQGVDNANR